MLSAIAGLFGTIFGWLGSLLPESPFSDSAQITADMQLGLSWLNWVFPISEMLLMLAGWIAVCFAVTVVRIALQVAGDVGSQAITKV